VLKKNTSSITSSVTSSVTSSGSGEAHVVELDIVVDHRGGTGLLSPVWVAWVSWSYKKDEDSEYDYRLWDFLALHYKHNEHEEYESSLFMMGAEQGRVWFVLPPEGGEFVVSVVRDRKHVIRGTRKKKVDASRILQYTGTSQVKDELDEDFVTIGAGKLTGPPYKLDTYGDSHVPGSTAALNGKDARTRPPHEKMSKTAAREEEEAWKDTCKPEQHKEPTKEAKGVDGRYDVEPDSMFVMEDDE